MKVLDIRANNRKKCFEIETSRRSYTFPYARLRLRPEPGIRIADVRPEAEMGNEGFTYHLEDGRTDTLHVDAVLDYNMDPEFIRDLHLYRMTLEALEALKGTRMSKRELIRALGTSPAQLYRLLDPTNYSKSMGQMMALLHLLGRKVEVTVSEAEPMS